MELWKVFLVCLSAGLMYAIFIYRERAKLAPKCGSVKPLNLVPRKHWPPGEKVSLVDDGTFSANNFRVAGNTFSDYANRSCTAKPYPRNQ